tara:strand:+ start:1500 stop:1919 length:420 start_codon:yes stop_codon:yes gene_type:complete
MDFSTFLSGAGTVAKSVLGEFGKSGSGRGGSGQDSASAAALEKIGFVQERQAAMNISEKAAQRGATRGKAEPEGRKVPSRMNEEVLQIYREAFHYDDKVQKAAIAQMQRDGYINMIPSDIDRSLTQADPRLKPKDIEMA